MNAFAGQRSGRPQFWLVSEVYYPEETSTGHYMTHIAEGLAMDCRVGVICARPNYSRRGATVARREERNGVSIFRVWSSTFDKNKLIRRLMNMTTAGISLFTVVLYRIRRGDRVLVGTNPPILPFLVAAACRLRGARCILKVEDVYPDNMVVAGLIAKGGGAERVLIAAQRRLYRGVEQICVLGRDMAERIADKAYPATPRLTWIPNWADNDVIRVTDRQANPLLAELGIGDQFVVGYAGNIGPLQNIPHLFACVRALADKPHIHFLVIGGGKMAEWLRTAIREAGLTNISLLGPRPRAEQDIFLGACDVGLVSLCPGMSGLGVPSRTYNLMAAGRPIMAVVDADSEIARLVREESIGWVVGPTDAPGFVAAVEGAAADRVQLREMGRRARDAADSKYSRARVIEQYREELF